LYAPAASKVTPEQDDRLYKLLGEFSRQVAELATVWKEMASKKPIRISDADSSV
jgi:hypothetical protein